MGNANTSFTALKAATLSNPTSATTFLSSDDSTKAAIVYFPVLGSGTTSAAFKFRARGRAKTTGAHNITPKVSYGTSTTAGSNTIIAAATARAGATDTASWLIEGTLYWNSTLKKLQGAYLAINGSTAVLDALAVLTNVPTAVDLTTAGNGLTVEITIATGGGDIGYLDELSLEVL